MTTQRTGSTVSTPQAVTEHLQTVTQSPTDYMAFFRDVVRRASDAGVSQQQLLDYISDNYKSGQNK